jgi:cytochrome b involved in lipid metabolism
MLKKTIVHSGIFIIICMAIVVGVTALFEGAGVSTKPLSPISTTQPSATNTETGATYTLAQVATHANGGDCWTTVNGLVYDVTSFISEHPGGSGAILGLCGIDGSAAFNDQHGGQRRPANELASFKIGTLIQ